jgi:hypothetical protein
MHIEHKSFQAVHADVPVDHRSLMSAMIATQGASQAAAAQIHYNVARNIAHSHEDAIVTLMQARLGWRAAAGVLEGSFHPGVAGLIHANGL